MHKLPGSRRRNILLAILTVAGVSLAASQAQATIPHSTTGVISGCYGANGELRVIDAEQGAACAGGETPLSWNATTIATTQWRSPALQVVPMARGGNVVQVALRQPGTALPAGTWNLTATVLIANSLNPPTSFRCFMQSRASLAFINGQLQDWGGDGGWHRTMIIPGLLILPQPDHVDVYCLHDQNLPATGGTLQIEDVHVIAQRAAAAF